MRVRFRYVSVQYGGKPTHMGQFKQGGWSWFHPMPYSREELWRPPTDVYETDEHVVVMMELAGVSEENVEVTIFDDVLVVAGSRTSPARPDKVRYYEVGINFGKFRSEVYLPIRVNPDCVEAELENGMLSIRLTKVCQ
jgi:HSP20 family protein